jgi:hypothetical protein
MPDDSGSAENRKMTRRMNEAEICKVRQISPKDWQEAQKRYEELVKMHDYNAAQLPWRYLPLFQKPPVQLRRLPNFWWVVAIVLALVGYFVPAWRSSLEIAFVVVMFQIGYRIGLTGGLNVGCREEYFVGYVNGFEAGINKVLGTDETKAKEARDRAAEMEKDDTDRALRQEAEVGTFRSGCL